MTIEEFDKLKCGDIVHFINDDSKMMSKYYNWEIIQVDECGIFIQNDYLNPKYISKEDAINLLKI